MADLEKFKKGRLIKQGILTVIFLIILIGGWWFPILGYFLPLCLLLGIGIAIRKGRKWCDWLCPRGSFYDLLMKRMSPLKDIPAFFKSHPFRIGVVAFFMTMVTVQLILRWPDPYKIGAFFITLLTVTTGIGVILVFFLHHRTWCTFCPAGSMAKWIGNGKFPLKINSELCVECNSCSTICPINVKPFLYRSEGVRIVKDYDCLKCNLCVEKCPQKALILK